MDTVRAYCIDQFLTNWILKENSQETRAFFRFQTECSFLSWLAPYSNSAELPRQAIFTARNESKRIGVILLPRSLKSSTSDTLHLCATTEKFRDFVIGYAIRSQAERLFAGPKFKVHGVSFLKSEIRARPLHLLISIALDRRMSIPVCVPLIS